MIALHQLLEGLSLMATAGPMDAKVKALHIDSRQVDEGDLFIAQVGTQVDGHQFIPKALEQGASAIVCEALPDTLKDGVAYVQVPDAREAAGLLASKFHGQPSHKLKIVGVTGTNGKTSVATLLYRLFGELGYKAGLLSTVENRVGETVIPATHTTPDPIQLQGLLAQMIKMGATHAFMEVSSHALDQRRTAGVRFAGGVFTNLTHDHLDYHGTFQNYLESKRRLFDGLAKDAFALTNLDDKRGKVMLQNTKARTSSYALRHPADYKAKMIDSTLEGLQLQVNGQEFWSPLVGAFNASNLLAVIGSAVELGEELEAVLTALSSIGNPPGRLERVPGSQTITAFVDYAHTPDALENVLSTLSVFREGQYKLISVVGCGGNRDKEKRPKMGHIAASLSDKTILTADNPRDEVASDILNQMREGVSIVDRKKTLVIEDRREAIRTACQLAGPGDIILVAGKGHEPYQEIAGVRHPFDDRVELAAALRELTQTP